MELRYFKDKEKREVDFVLLENKRPTHFIEVKESDTTLSPSLRYLRERYAEVQTLQLVRKYGGKTQLQGCKVVSGSEWLVKELLKEPKKFR